MSLKELTKQNHSNAERSWFAGRMFSGEITNSEYAIYLKQQYESYKALENRFNSVDIVYRDTNFIEHTAKYSALTAIILQHELDHLDGVLISMKGIENE